MARATKAAAKPKKKATRSKRRVSLFELMPTNTWFKAMHFVHYEIESKDWVSIIKEYITKNFDLRTRFKKQHICIQECVCRCVKTRLLFGNILHELHSK